MKTKRMDRKPRGCKRRISEAEQLKREARFYALHAR